MVGSGDGSPRASLPVNNRSAPGPGHAGGAGRTARTDRLLCDFVKTRDTRLRERLVLLHQPLVWQLASRFPSRVVPREDVVQVGTIGLILALDRFDPARGRSFIRYAVPTILGEIKRYFRDQSWAMKVPRKARELGLSVRRVRADLEQQLGRAPTIQEVAEATDVSEEQLLEAIDVEHAYNLYSLDDEVDPACVAANDFGAEDPAFERVEERDALSRALRCLEPREERIIRLRFFEECSQTEVAWRVGISQVHVSRLERRALKQLRQLLGGPCEDRPSGPSPHPKNAAASAAGRRAPGAVPV
jgi:RNA polymerase sigma-B factor